MIKHLFFIVFILVNFVEAKDIFVVADNARVNVYNPKIGEFLGRVKVKKDKDRLTSNKLYVYFKDKRPVKYVAFEDVNFEISMNKKIYKGTGDSVTYHPESNKYVVEGNAIVESDKERLTGDILTLEPNKAFEAASKSDGPIKLIIDVNND